MLLISYLMNFILNLFVYHIMVRRYVRIELEKNGRVFDKVYDIVSSRIVCYYYFVISFRMNNFRISNYIWKYQALGRIVLHVIVHSTRTHIRVSHVVAFCRTKSKSFDLILMFSLVNIFTIKNLRNLVTWF